MRKLFMSFATAAVLISIAGAAPIATILGETSIVAPIMKDHRLPALPEREHWLRHARVPLIMS